MFHPLAQFSEKRHHLFRRAQSLFPEIQVYRIVIQLSGLPVTPHGNQGFHGNNFIVGQRIDLSRIGAQFFHLQKIPTLLQQTRCPFDALTEHAPVSFRLLHYPQDTAMERKKLPRIAVTGLQPAFRPAVRILLLFRLSVQTFKFFRILRHRNLLCPVIQAVFLLYVIHIRESRCPEFLFCIVNNAAQGVPDISHVPVLKQNFL